MAEYLKELSHFYLSSPPVTRFCRASEIIQAYDERTKKVNLCLCAPIKELMPLILCCKKPKITKQMNN